jgi:hypothetical protein
MYFKKIKKYNIKQNGGYYLNDDRDKNNCGIQNNTFKTLMVKHISQSCIFYNKCDYTKIITDKATLEYISNLVNKFFDNSTYDQLFYSLNTNKIHNNTNIYMYHINFSALMFLSFFVEYELFSILRHIYMFNTQSQPNNNNLVSIFNTSNLNNTLTTNTRIYIDTLTNLNIREIITNFTYKLDVLFINFMNTLINHLIDYIKRSYCVQISHDMLKKYIVECITPVYHCDYRENTYDYIYVNWKQRLKFFIMEKCNNKFDQLFFKSQITNLINLSLESIVTNNTKYIAEATGFFSFIYMVNTNNPNSTYYGSCITYSMIELYIMSRLHINGSNINLTLENQIAPNFHTYWKNTQQKLNIGISHWTTKFIFSNSKIINRSAFPNTGRTYNFNNNRKQFLQALIYPIYDSYIQYIEINKYKFTQIDYNNIMLLINTRISQIEQFINVDLFSIAENIIDSKQILNYLFRFSTDEINNIKNDRNQSLIYYAARKGNINFIQSLINRGVNINIKNPDGSTALHGAAYGFSTESENNRFEIIILLKKYNIDVSIKNNYGEIAKTNVINSPYNSDTIKNKMLAIL